MPAFMDVLTGGAGHQAAQDQRNVLAALIPQLATDSLNAYGGAGNTLTAGYGQARNDLGTGYGASTGAINAGAGGALDYLAQGQQGAMGQLGQARGDLTANGGAFQPLSALASQYGQGAGMYANSLGLNGQQGNQQAIDAYQRGPGYAAGQEAGLDAITRHANAAGGLGGNSLRDTMKFGVDYQNQDYGKWQDRLAAFNPLQLQATQGAATGNQANNTTLANLGVQGANLLNTGGQNRAQVATGQATNLADLARQYYGQLGANDIGGAGALAGNTIAGNANRQNLFTGAIPQWNDTYKQDAKATNDAGAQQIGLAKEVAKLAVSAAAGGMGGMPGLPSGGSNYAGLGGWA